MGDTFYSVLGVNIDADQETIRRAYRERVKDAHPDVSDNPDAGERFKRLTTARDVLVDTDERQRYDQLGHDTYVRRHVETPVWEPSQRQTTGGTSTSSAATTSTSASGSTGDTGRTASTSQSTTGTSRSTAQATSQTAGQSTASSSKTGGQGATPDGGYGASWQQAPDEYMRSSNYTEPVESQTLIESLRQVGPWLLVHVVLLSSAVGTGSFILARASTDPTISLSAALFMIVMLALVVVLSVLHLLTEAYT